MSSAKKREECFTTAETLFSDKTVENKEIPRQNTHKNINFVIFTKIRIINREM